LHFLMSAMLCSVDIWTCADRLVCGFLLLLFQELAEQ